MFFKYETKALRAKNSYEQNLQKLEAARQDSEKTAKTDQSCSQEMNDMSSVLRTPLANSKNFFNIVNEVCQLTAEKKLLSNYSI